VRFCSLFFFSAYALCHISLGEGVVGISPKILWTLKCCSRWLILSRTIARIQHQYSPSTSHSVVTSQVQTTVFFVQFAETYHTVFICLVHFSQLSRLLVTAGTVPEAGRRYRRRGASDADWTSFHRITYLITPRSPENRDTSCIAALAFANYSMSASVPMSEPQVLQVPCLDLSEDQEYHLRRPRAYVLFSLDSPGLVVWRWVEQANFLLKQHRSTTTLDTPGDPRKDPATEPKGLCLQTLSPAHVEVRQVPTAGTTTAIPSDKTAGSGDSVETSHVQRPEGQRSVSNPRPSALRAILGTAPAVILHIAAGTSLAASATIPPLRGSSKVSAPWWIAMYATWGAAFGIFLTLELRRLPDWAQRRLLMGLFIFSGLNLTGSLVQGGDSMLEGVVSWSPLAMTASLLLVPMLMMFWGVRGAVEVAGVY